MGIIRPLVGLGVAVLVGSCVESAVEPEVAVTTTEAEIVTIDPRRSLAITDAAILERFPFERVMQQLVDHGEVEGLTPLALFQQWWDTQNPPGCTGQLNGFPYTCRPAPAEGALAAVDPFVDPDTNPDAFVPIGLFNRFDLTPGDATTCGEYRIVYAKRSGITNSQDRLLVIFEMAVRNPLPHQGLKGCRKIAKQWAALSELASVEARADQLEAMYFDGYQGLRPIVHVKHLGAGPTGVGQIRTNQFMAHGTGIPWVLREFKLARTCAGEVDDDDNDHNDVACSEMRVVPVSVKGNPFGPLFAPTSEHALAPAFRVAFASQVEALAAPGLTEIDFAIDDTFNAGHSVASAMADNNYVALFGQAASPLRAAVAAELAALDSALSPEDIVARAQSLSCAGCHRLNNGFAIGGGLIHPSAIGFVHVTERETEVVDGEVRFVLSPALTNAFLPKRKQVMEAYFAETLKQPKRPKDPIGERRPH